jgi:menaquinol-cytochrome c reductase iron-sulfur subunit
MPDRRNFFRLGAMALGNLFGLALVVPGLKYLLDPLGKKSSGGEFLPLTRLGQLKVGEPQAFAIIAERQDAWVKYPREPIGSVWLIRQPEGSKEPVLALTAECPHLGCPVNLAPDRKTFLCPCHQAAFKFDGQKTNEVAPRGMDSLPVVLSADSDPEVAVKFERFQPQTAEKKPLA